MSETDEQRAAKLFAEAEKKAKGQGSGFFSSIFGGRSEDANEIYVKAANVYKIAKKWNEAGNSFVRAAEFVLQRGEARHEAASNYCDAANCYRKTEARRAVDCLAKAAEIYTDMGRFTMAAKHHTTIAEIYESELPDVEQAMMNYEKAGDYYKGEESKSSANKCLLQVAKYAAQLEQYQKAIQIYEDVGTTNADNNLLKYSAKEYFFRAALCHLCVDVINAQHALKRYEDLHPAFSDSRECKFVKDLLIAVEEQNPDLFTETVQSYDKISRLDDWYTTLLVRIKRQCGEGEDDLK